jgi:uncharacterized protein YdaU (DUF1376 family)
MAEFAALPVFTDAIIADTQHLTDAEFGRYFRLLMITWRSQECRIPNDPAWICKRLRIDPLQYEKEVKPLIVEFFREDADAHANASQWLTQKRLKKEWKYTIQKREKNRESAKARWEKEKIPCERISKRNAPSPSPSPTKKSGKMIFSDENEIDEDEFIRECYDIEKVLSDKAIQAAREAAPGWDVYILMRDFNTGIKMKKLEIPKNPDSAFPAWCRAIKKGKRPS